MFSPSWRRCCVSTAAYAEGVRTQGSSGRRSRPEAKKLLFELQGRIENFQLGPANVELAKKIVAARSELRHGPVLPLRGRRPCPPKPRRSTRRPASWPRTRSEGERRFIEAMYHARVNQGIDFKKSIEPAGGARQGLSRASGSVHVILGQLYNGDGQGEKARRAFEKAQAIGPRSARVEAFLAGDDLLQGAATARRAPPTSTSRRACPRARSPSPSASASPSATSTKATSTRPSSRCAPTSTSTGRAAWTSSSPRSSSGTPWPASTWRTAASTRP